MTLLNDTLLGELDGEPIWLLCGAEEEEEETEEETEEEETEEEGQEEEKESARKHPPSGKKDKPAPKKNYTPPSEREWLRTQAALKKANEAQAAARKAALEKARKEGMDEAAAKARQEAIEEQENRYRPMIYKKEARSLLAEQNCRNPSRFLPMIDFSKCTLDDEGEVLGLEDQINGIKEEFPEAFKQETESDSKKKSAPPAKKVGAASGTKETEKPDKGKPTGASRIAGRLLGTKS